MIGTFMAWLKDVDAGGGTSYLIPGKYFFPSLGNIYALGKANAQPLLSFPTGLIHVPICSSLQQAYVDDV